MMVPLLNPLRRPAVGPGGKAFVPNVNRVQPPPVQSVSSVVSNDTKASSSSSSSSG